MAVLTLIIYSYGLFSVDMTLPSFSTKRRVIKMAAAEHLL